MRDTTYAALKPARNGLTNPSKKPRIPPLMRMIRWTYPKLEWISPAHAHHWFVKMFFSPPRYPIPQHEKQFSAQAERTQLRVANKKIQTYAWGKGPIVLFVHGWAGRATQFRYFVEHFTKNGFRAVAFDAPAHGFSEGSATHIFEFKDSLLELQNHLGSIHAIVSHSLGGTASLFALTEGLHAEKLVTIATPTLADEILHEFTIRLRGSERSKNHLQQFIHKKFNRPFDSLMASYFAQQLNTEINMLIIHDENDREASIQNAHHLRLAYPKASLIETKGLGHVRILRDTHIIEECRKFIAGS